MTIDLHTHTYFSDGRPSPKVLLHAAAEHGWLKHFDRLGCQPVTPEILVELEQLARQYQRQ